MFGIDAILAHQGGWDEMLLVAAPIAVFVLLLRFANRRAAKLGDTTAPTSESAVPSPLDHTVAPKGQHGAGSDDDSPSDD